MLSLIVILTIYAVVPLAAVLLARPALPTRRRSEEDPFINFHIEQSFDPDEAIIWDTQLPALQLMASSQQDGLPIESLYCCYGSSRRLYPELYDGSTFDSWLACLERNQLIRMDGGRAWLRKEGRAFLHYRATSVRHIDRHSQWARLNY